MAAPRLLSLSRLLTTASATSTTVLHRTISSTVSSSTTRFSLLRTISAFRRPHAAALPSSPWRLFSTRQSQNSLNDSSPNWSNRPPKETILLDGCDFEHWLVVTDPPPEEWTRDEIIDYYIKTLATVVGSEDEARMKIYSVSTKHYFAFGALVSEELSYKLKELEKVRWVLPDSYLDVKNKDYGGEPFIDGQAVPYDPKYHEEWVRNNQKAKERNNRNDRPRNSDRSRNFDRRQRTQTFQNPSGGNMGGPPPPQPGGAPNNPGFSPNMPPPNAGYQQNMPPRNAGYQQNLPPPPNSGYQQNIPPNNPGFQQNMPPNNAGYQQNMPRNNAPGYQNPPPNNSPGFQNMPPNNSPGFQNMPPNPAAGYPPPVNNAAGYPQNMPPSNYGGQGNPGYNNSAPNYQAGGGMPYQNNTQAGAQQNYAPNTGFPSQNVPGRDMQ
ncbi:hypothetical protein RND81_09G013200 [Saponaria officinalis]|uniref:MORF/ORRM1/DAG-like MORF domain-containing protein n=1 Tax=Saponaria officinalis TaxID=3572 RepID=A0AAW1IHI0_SAPOF